MNKKLDFAKLENPFFIVTLILLLLNDFYLKSTFHNFWTGKLSDFSGVIVLFFMLHVFVSKRLTAVIASSILFFLWKLPLSQPFIDLLNWNGILQFHRVIDYSDLTAVLILIPFAYREFELKNKMQSKVLRAVLFFVGIFAVAATSRGDYRMFGEVYMNKDLHLNTSSVSFLQSLEKQQVSYKFIDRRVYKGDTTLNYELYNLTDSLDTIYTSRISLRPQNDQTVILRIVEINFSKDHRPYPDMTYEKSDSIQKHFQAFALGYFVKLSDTIPLKR